MRDDYGTAGELEERVFQGAECFDVEVVRRLVKQQQVSALFERQRQVETVALTTGEPPAFFCWSGPLKPNAET